MVDLSALLMQTSPQGRGGHGSRERVTGEGFAEMLFVNSEGKDVTAESQRGFSFVHPRREPLPPEKTKKDELPDMDVNAVVIPPGAESQDDLARLIAHLLGQEDNGVFLRGISDMLAEAQLPGGTEMPITLSDLDNALQSLQAVFSENPQPGMEMLAELFPALSADAAEAGRDAGLLEQDAADHSAQENDVPGQTEQQSSRHAEVGPSAVPGQGGDLPDQPEGGPQSLQEPSYKDRSLFLQGKAEASPDSLQSGTLEARGEGIQGQDNPGHEQKPIADEPPPLLKDSIDRITTVKEGQHVLNLSRSSKAPGLMTSAEPAAQDEALEKQPLPEEAIQSARSAPKLRYADIIAAKVRLSAEQGSAAQGGDGSQEAGLLADSEEELTLLKARPEKQEEGFSRKVNFIQSFQNAGQNESVPLAGKAETASTVRQAMTENIIEQVVQDAALWKTGEGTALTLELSPRFLGKISILLMTAAGGGVTAHIKAENESVRAILASETETLRASLKDSGINMEDIEVSDSDISWDFSRNSSWQDGSGQYPPGYDPADRIAADYRIRGLPEEAEAIDGIGEEPPDPFYQTGRVTAGNGEDAAFDYRA
ncbi:MAG: flagellar hook-length control protein FliK [Oscillospiraceae bacterium]|nr:flagellar hook-length control protein FliK [Oscillospiraceae bacterium]